MRSLGAIASAAGTDIDDLCVVEDAVDDGMGNRWISQRFPPLFKADFCGKNHCHPLVTHAD